MTRDIKRDIIIEKVVITIKERAILHCDCNSFYASVELLSYPEYKDVPVVVGGDENSRHGIVLAKNEAAKKLGIKTAQTIYQVRRICPEIIVLPAHHSLYSKYSEILNNIYNSYTDLVEPFGIDESWLDVTNSYHLFASSPKELADIIRQRIKTETGLTVSVGVSFNKIFAKLGSDYKKPDATTEITRENFKEIVWKLPVQDLLYVGNSTYNSLRDMGVHTIGELAILPQEVLNARFGKHGDELHIFSNGLDNSKVNPFDNERIVKSVGSGNTFSVNLKKRDEIKPALMSLCEDVGWRLRRKEVFAGGIQLSIKDPNFVSFSRQCKISPTNITKIIYNTALELMDKNWDYVSSVRALTVTAIDIQLTEQPLQISLFEENQVTVSKKDKNLQTALDNIKLKFGNNAVTNANAINNKNNKNRI